MIFGGLGRAGTIMNILFPVVDYAHIRRTAFSSFWINVCTYRFSEVHPLL